MVRSRVHGLRAVLAGVWAVFAVVCIAVLVPQSAMASGDANSTACPNEALVGFEAYLPDCRAYEQVTPPYKDGYIVTYAGASEDGEHVVGHSLGTFGGAIGAPQTRQTVGLYYEFLHTAAGWQTRPLTPANPEYRDASTFAALSSGATESIFKMPAAPVGQDNFFVRRANGELTNVGPVTPPADGPTQEPAPEGGPATNDVREAGATPDLSHILFYLRGPFGWPAKPGDGTAEGEFNLYEYSGGEATPRMVAVSGGAGSTTLLGECGVNLGGPQNSSSYNAQSANGESVFFTPIAEDEGLCGLAEPVRATLYARLKGSETVDLSAVQCTPGWCEATTPSDAVFSGASQDGSRVFFLSTQQLTGDSVEDSNASDTADGRVGEGCDEAQGSGCNLYEYDFARPEGERLRAISTGSASPHVQGVVRISPDGSHVYFVATGALPSEPGIEGDTPEPGANNLYVFEPESGPVRFIHKLSSEDSALWGGGSGNDNGRPAQTTGNGRVLVFDSNEDLTPDDTSTGATQVFEYEDSAIPTLRRISIGNDGFNDDGNTELFNARILAPSNGPKAWSEPQKHTMSESGSTIAFESEDSLVPGTSPAQFGDDKIYEYREGHVYAIYGGATPGAELLDMDASGNNVFFQTTEALVPSDVDTQADIYDARVDGGQPAQSSAACAGEACLGAPSAPPQAPAPAGSALVSGNGNFAPVAPPKPAVKKASPTKAQKLAKALKVCRRKRRGKVRARCERTAHERFGGKR